MSNVFFPLSEKEMKKKGITDRYSVTENTEFPQRLRALREEKSETLAVAAKAIGITRSTLGLYEKGTNVPDVKIIVRIARHYGATTNYLLGEDERPTYDTDFICDKTGLSEKAVAKLCEMEQERRKPSFTTAGLELEALSALVASSKRCDFLLSLYSYLFEVCKSIKFKNRKVNTEFTFDDLFMISVANQEMNSGQGLFKDEFEIALQAARMAQMQNALSDLRKEIVGVKKNDGKH